MWIRNPESRYTVTLHSNEAAMVPELFNVSNPILLVMT